MRKRNIKIAASLLSADFSRLGDQIALIANAGIDYLHIDVMDGHFVPNISIGLPIVESLKKTSSIPLDVHLMIESPSKYVNDFAKAGADIITVHMETDPHMHRLIDSIKKLNVKAGVALNPSTNLSSLDEIIHLVDLVLIMSVNPGFGGQHFIPDSLNKITRLRQILENRNKGAELQVDGGISEGNIVDIIEAGADFIVIGNAIFSSSDIYATAIRMKQLANSAD